MPWGNVHVPLRQPNIKKYELVVAPHASIPSSHEGEAGGLSQTQGQPGLHNEYPASKHILKKKRKENRNKIRLQLVI